MIAGLLAASAAGCVWLFHAHPHGVAALMASTLAIAPLMTLALLALGVVR